MKYRLATMREFKDGWLGLREVCGATVATICMLILLVTYPVTGWVRKDEGE